MAYRTYANLERDDGETEVVKAKCVLSRQVTRHGDSLDRGIYVTFGRRLTKREAIDALTEMFVRRCNCSHDCCGHTQFGIWTQTVRRTRARTWFVVTHNYLNV